MSILLLGEPTVYYYIILLIYNEKEIIEEKTNFYCHVNITIYSVIERNVHIIVHIHTLKNCSRKNLFYFFLSFRFNKKRIGGDNRQTRTL